VNNEIWFKRVLWSYMPCHWKGWAVLAAVVSFGVSSIFVGTQVAKLVGRPDLAQWAFLLIFVFVGIALHIAKRHSEDN